ncbi:hypothetical protein Syun_029553 [Stephania yunnanensis]|uniref:K+ potassium transporter integral membrane domain-containing protein n=1 Tax=Stephania yunnanensis TaxID=152371 RepID=A0AAP0EE17_9MAGN
MSIPSTPNPPNQNPQIPQVRRRVSSRSLLFGSRPTESGARGSATPATLPSRPSWPRNHLGMRSWGPTTPNLGLGFGSGLGFELALRQGRVFFFLRSSSSSSRLRLVVVDSLCFEPQFRMCFGFTDLRLHGGDVYFSLEDFGFGLADGAQAQARRKDSHSKFSIGESLAFTENFVYLDFDSASPPEHAWRRRLNNHANLLREFSVTFREAVKMVVPPYELPALTKGYLFPLYYKLARPPDLESTKVLPVGRVIADLYIIDLVSFTLELPQSFTGALVAIKQQAFTGFRAANTEMQVPVYWRIKYNGTFLEVMSAVSGLQDVVVIVSILILIGLFSIQSFGTCKVGFLFAPVLALWFFSLGTIGIYNIIKYDWTVMRLLDDEAVYYKVAGDCPKGCVYSLRSLWRKKRRYVDRDASTSQHPQGVVGGSAGDGAGPMVVFSGLDVMENQLD